MLSFYMLNSPIADSGIFMSNLFFLAYTTI